MFRRDCDVDITLDWEGSVEHDLTLVGILEIKDGKQEHKFYFRQSTREYFFDQAEAMVVNRILEWLQDNSVISLPKLFGVKVIDFPEDNEEGEDNDEIVEEKELGSHLQTLESFIKVFESYKQDEEHKSNLKPNGYQFVDRYYERYVEIGGKLAKEKFADYLRFFLTIVPPTFLGDGFELGFNNREESIYQWMAYLNMKGESKDIVENDSELVFKAVDDIHPLT